MTAHVASCKLSIGLAAAERNRQPDFTSEQPASQLYWRTRSIFVGRKAFKERKVSLATTVPMVPMALCGVLALALLRMVLALTEIFISTTQPATFIKRRAELIPSL